MINKTERYARKTGGMSCYKGDLSEYEEVKGLYRRREVERRRGMIITKENKAD